MIRAPMERLADAATRASCAVPVSSRLASRIRPTMPNTEPQVVRVGDFLPSRHGFRFSNCFPKGPLVSLRVLGRTLPLGDASRGLCGGMVFAVRDFFDQGQVIPQALSPPDPGSPLFNYLV